MTASSLPSAEDQPQPVEDKTLYTKEFFLILVTLFCFALFGIITALYWRRPLPSWVEVVLMADLGVIVLLPLFVGTIALVKFYRWYGVWVLIVAFSFVGPYFCGFIMPFIHWKRYGWRKSLWALIPIAAWIFAFPVVLLFDVARLP